MRILIILLLMPFLSIGQTLRTVGSGGTYSTIQAAINAASVNDTIDILSGTFTESVDISKNGLYLRGNGSTLNGFETLSGWTDLGGGIYEATVATPMNGQRVAMLTIDGIPRHLARWPNTASKTYQSYTTSVDITDTALSGFPSLVGGEIVRRTTRWTWYRDSITNHSGNTLTFVNQTSQSNTREPITGLGWGYYLENHPALLDTLFEWCYLKAGQKVRVYFGANDPDDYVVKVTTLRTLINVDTATNVTITGMNLQGSNGESIKVGYETSDVTIDNCNISYNGNDAVLIYFSPSPTITNNTIYWTQNMGLFVHDCDSMVITGNLIEKTGHVTGMHYAVPSAVAASTQTSGTGIQAFGSNGLIEKNIIKESGYNGIKVAFPHGFVVKNLVDGYNSISDDGGGIYSGFGTDTITYENNIVLNGYHASAIDGAKQQTAGTVYSHGIYLDGGDKNKVVKNNVVFDAGQSGIFLNLGKYNTIDSNLVYGSQMAFQLWSQYAPLDAIENYVRGNTFIANVYALMATSLGPKSGDSLFGTFSGNRYVGPIDWTQSVFLYRSDGQSTTTWNGWKSLGYDADSYLGASALSLYTSSDNPSTYYRTEYNASDTIRKVYLNGNTYQDTWGTAYSDTLEMQPWSGSVLILTDGAPVNTAPTANAGADATVTYPTISTSLSGSGTDSDGTIASYSWSIVSGTGGSIASASSQNTTFTGTPGNTYTIRLTVTDNEGATDTDDKTVTVNKASQTITFNTLASKEVGDDPFELSATSTSGLTVSFSSSNTSVATVSGTTVTIVGAGTTNITASQSGNGNYLAASNVVRSLTVTSEEEPEEPTISPRLNLHWRLVVRKEEPEEPTEPSTAFTEEFTGKLAGWIEVDNTTELQDAIAAVDNGDLIFLNNGLYEISNTLTVTNKIFYLIGNHPDSVTIKWTGGEYGTMLRLDRCPYSKVSRIKFTSPGKHAVMIDKSSYEFSPLQTGAEISDCIFYHGTVGIMLGDKGNASAEVSIRRNKFIELWHGGVVAADDNTLNVWVEGNSFANCAFPVTNYLEVRGINAGAYHVWNNNFSNTTFNDIRLQATEKVSIRGNRSTSSSFFVAGFNSNAAPTVLEDNEAGSVSVANLGSLIMLDNKFSSVSFNPDSVGSFIARGNTFSGASPYTFGSYARIDTTGNYTNTAYTISLLNLPATPAKTTQTIREATGSDVQDKLNLGGIVHLPNGDYSGTLNIDGNTILEGNGEYTIWTGTINLSDNAQLRNIKVIGTGSAGVNITSDSVYIDQAQLAHNTSVALDINGGYTYVTNSGIMYGSDTAVKVNNATATFIGNQGAANKTQFHINNSTVNIKTYWWEKNSGGETDPLTFAAITGNSNFSFDNGRVVPIVDTLTTNTPLFDIYDFTGKALIAGVHYDNNITVRGTGNTGKILSIGNLLVDTVYHNTSSNDYRMLYNLKDEQLIDLKGIHTPDVGAISTSFINEMLEQARSVHIHNRGNVRLYRVRVEGKGVVIN